MRLLMKEISKRFPGVVALDSINLELNEGEIHAIVGENGAGKSTLIKILGGAIVPDSGKIELEGKAIPFGSPLGARKRGINIIYQEFMLVPGLTVAENIFLGRELGGFVPRFNYMRQQAEGLLTSIGAKFSATARVGELSVAQQQMVEIARALSTDSKVLVLDEPTATLSDQEVERLFKVLRNLKHSKIGIIYISHRLEEIFAIADRVTVLRDGRHVATAPISNTDRVQLIRWMVGRELSEEFPAKTSKPANPILEVRNLSCRPYFDNVSFSVRQGEIVGLAGLVGSGRTSVGLALIGALKAKGEILINGQKISFSSPHDAIGAGLAYVTEDRKERGIFHLLDACANITVTYLSDYAKMGILNLRKEKSRAAHAANEFDLRGAGIGQNAGTLSGGNQQKVLLARYLLKPRRLLILDEPTRGIDIGAKSEIYKIMNQLASQGLAIIMISSDLPEIIAMSDRVVVLHEGRTTGVLSRSEATPQRIMELATK